MASRGRRGSNSRLRELEDAIDSLLSLPSTSTKRLAALADFIKREFKRQGLSGLRGGSDGELRVPGLSREKNWDLAYEFAGKFRLLVSLKSMLKNVSGSVPNRLDDLQGEVANVQQLRPEIVTGYVILFDIAQDSVRNDGVAWSDYFEAALRKMAIRKAPMWNQGLLEGICFVRFDSRKPAEPRLVDGVTALAEIERFVVALLCELKLREPAIRLPNTFPCDPES